MTIITSAESTEPVASHELRIVRTFEAPRGAVFRAWIEPAQMSSWFAPDGFEVTLCEIAARPGGRWRVHYRSAEGAGHREHGTLEELVEPERLVFTLTQEDEEGHRGSVTRVQSTRRQ